LPVIVSDIPTMHELVTENVNGIFAGSDNAALLADKLLWFMENKQAFNSKEITDTAADKYNYAVVGKMFSDWYNGVAG
jgi:glycosyltransferase involved in cell wall biosynthesis